MMNFVKKKILFVLVALNFVSLCSCIKSNVNGTITPLVVIGDRGNSRILIYQNFISANLPQASVVLGQPDFNQNVANNTPGAQGTVSAYSIGAASGGVLLVKQKLFSMDGANNRVLVWNNIPTVNQTPADFALGQPDLGSSLPNNGGISASSLRASINMASDGTHFLVADYLNNRVLIWNSIPYKTGQPADIVLGQPDMAHANANNPTVALGLSGVQGVATDGSHIAVSDRFNNRILIWNSFPSTNGMSADLVLGQPYLSTVTANNTPGSAGTVGAQALSYPQRLIFTQGKLLAIDGNNQRVLIWNSVPTVNQQAADLVIGQPDMVSIAINNTPGATGTVSAQSISGPSDLAGDGQRLFISDDINNRTLLWNSIPTINQQPADLVIGQPDMGSSANSVGMQGQYYPWGITANTGIFGVTRPGGY